MYQSLKSLGKETELVLYPGEFHDFKEPSHLKDRLERYLAWYADYVKADGTAARPIESRYRRSAKAQVATGCKNRKTSSAAKSPRPSPARP